MRTPLRRAIALAGLTAAVVISGSIAAADGPAVRDITDLALSTAAEPAELPLDTPTTAAPAIEPTVAAQLRVAEGGSEGVRAARTPRVPVRGSRVADDPGWTGRASWYGPGFHGRRTANGEVYDQYAMTAAHKTLPFGTELRVTNVGNGRSVVVRINDRGPFIPGRDIDLSRAAAEALGFAGVITVKVQEL